MHISLDVGGQLILTCDMSPLAATADVYAVEAIYGSSEAAEHLGEPTPAADMRPASAGRNADNSHIVQVDA